MDLDPITKQLAVLNEQLEQADALANDPDCPQDTLEALDRLRLAAQSQIDEATAVLAAARAIDSMTDAWNVP